jgi:hypothetical protein
MRRTDILPEHIPFVDKVDEAGAFLYYSRFHFMEGITGEDGHTEVIVFLQSQPHACWRFGGIDYWKNRRDVQTVRQQVLFDEPFPCRVFIRMLQKLVRNGILDIPSQEKSWSLGHLHETVGIRIKIIGKTGIFLQVLHIMINVMKNMLHLFSFVANMV